MAGEGKAAPGAPDRRVGALCASGAEAMVARRYKEALADFQKALAIAPDTLYAHYGAGYCLACLANAAPAPEASALRREVLAHGERIVALAPEPILSHDAFALMCREMLRFTYNSRAWYRMLGAGSREELERALADADHGLGIRSPNEDGGVLNALRDTRVRILLKLERVDEAFDIVRAFPQHPDFKDLVADPRFKAGDGGDVLLRGRPEETAGEALVRLRDAIAKYGHYAYQALVFSAPATPKEVADAERTLDCALPPSYVRFVTRHGACKLIQTTRPPVQAGTPYPKLHGCREVLGPRGLVNATLEIQDRDENRSTRKKLEDSLAFQQNAYDDNFFTFRVSSAKKHGGEMGVHAYFHDDVYAFDRKHVGFDEHIREWVKEILDARHRS